MQPIETSVDTFVDRLQRGESLVVTEKGQWGRRCLISRLARKILGLFIHIDDTVEAAQQLGKYLSTSLVIIHKGQIQGLCASKAWKGPDVDRLVKGVQQILKSRMQKEQAVVEKLSARKESLETAIAAAQPSGTPAPHPDEVTTTEIVSLKKSICKYGVVRHAAADLERARISFHYANQSNTDLKSAAETKPASGKAEQLRWLFDTLKTWQRNQAPFVDYTASSLAPFTIEKLTRLCHYPEFVKAMHENITLSDLFFEAVFRSMAPDCIDAVDLFILAPSIQKKIAHTFTDKRIQNIRTIQAPLQVSEVGRTADGLLVRDVKLLFHNTLQSIVDPSHKITIADVNPEDVKKATGDAKKLQALTEATQRTVKDIFATLEFQNDYFIDLEWRATGFEVGSSLFPDLDLSRADWWKQLPLFEKPLTRKEIEERFGVPFQTGKALFIVSAARTTPDLSAQDTHASSILLVPLDDEGKTFNLIQFGMFTETFPNTFISKFLHIFRSHRAVISLSDPNKAYSSRFRTFLPLPALDEKTFEGFMNKLRNDLMNTRNGLIVFQAQGHNCAEYIRECIRFLYPHLGLEPFETPFEEISLPSILMPLIHARKVFPTRGSWNVFRFLVCCLLGAWQTHYFPDGKGGKRAVSLLRYRPWRAGTLQLPAKLFETKKYIEQMIREATPENNSQPRVPISSTVVSTSKPCGSEIEPIPAIPAYLQAVPTVVS